VGRASHLSCLGDMDCGRSRQTGRLSRRSLFFAFGAKDVAALLNGNTKGSGPQGHLPPTASVL